MYFKKNGNIYPSFFRTPNIIKKYVGLLNTLNKMI